LKPDPHAVAASVDRTCREIELDQTTFGANGPDRSLVINFTGYGSIWKPTTRKYPSPLSTSSFC